MSGELEISMNYPMAEDMASAFTDAAQSINEIEAAVKQIVSQLRNDALVGDAGEAVCEVLEKDLVRVLQDIEGKMTELAGDVSTAIRVLRDGDRTAASRFA
jgi:uncharacterized protein YukE